MSDIIKCLISVEKVFYPKKKIESGDWAAFTASVEEIYEGTPQFNEGSRLSVSGIVPAIDYFDKYVLIGKLVEHETYGNKYEILNMSKLVNLSDVLKPML